MDQLTRATVYPRLSLDGFVRRIEEAQEEVATVRKKLKRERFEHNATKHEMIHLNIELRRVHSDNFFYQFKTSKLRKLMRRINSFFVLCSCRACVETGRYLVEPVTGGSVCSFTPYWEELLRIYDISFEFRRRVGAPIDETKSPMGATMLCSVAIVNIGPDPFWRHVAYGSPITETRMSCRDGHSEMRRRLARLFDFVEDSQLNGEEPAPRDDESDEGTMSVAADSQPMSPSQRASVSDHTSPRREISEEF